MWIWTDTLDRDMVSLGTLAKKGMGGRPDVWTCFGQMYIDGVREMFGLDTYNALRELPKGEPLQLKLDVTIKG